MKILVVLAMAMILGAPSLLASEELDFGKLEWLAGEWVGQGREGDDGAVQGEARLYWTPPKEGVASYLFTWHAPQNSHVHYAFSVFREAPNGITGDGIHFGRDFENFEEHPWQLEAEAISTGFAAFRCVDHCRSQLITFTLQEDGSLEERWSDEDGSADWIVTYRRAENTSPLP